MRRDFHIDVHTTLWVNWLMIFYFLFNMYSLINQGISNAKQLVFYYRNAHVHWIITNMVGGNKNYTALNISVTQTGLNKGTTGRRN